MRDIIAALPAYAVAVGGLLEQVKSAKAQINALRRPITYLAVILTQT